jgi:hypothetical protein
VTAHVTVEGGRVGKSRPSGWRSMGRFSLQTLGGEDLGVSGPCIERLKAESFGDDLSCLCSMQQFVCTIYQFGLPLM